MAQRQRGPVMSRQERAAYEKKVNSSWLNMILGLHSVIISYFQGLGFNWEHFVHAFSFLCFIMVMKKKIHHAMDHGRKISFVSGDLLDIQSSNIHAHDSYISLL